MQVFLNNRYGFLKRISMISATLSLKYTSEAGNVTRSVIREGKDRQGRCECYHFGEFLLDPRRRAPGRGAGGPCTQHHTHSLAILHSHRSCALNGTAEDGVGLDAGVAQALIRGLRRSPQRGMRADCAHRAPSALLPESPRFKKIGDNKGGEPPRPLPVCVSRHGPPTEHACVPRRRGPK